MGCEPVKAYFDKVLGRIIVPEGACPYPILGDDGTAYECKQHGHCGCDEMQKPDEE